LITSHLLIIKNQSFSTHQLIKQGIRADFSSQKIIYLGNVQIIISASFQYAVDIWSKILNLNQPIIINADFAPLVLGVLG